MKHLFKSLLLTPLLFSAISCQSLGSNEVSKTYWNNYISEGGLFTGNSSFTMDSKHYEGNEVVFHALIQKEKKKMHITTTTNKKELEFYYEINSKDTYSLYFKEDNEWTKETELETSDLLEEMLIYTIQYNFKYDSFIYDKETLTYVCDGFKNESFSFDSVKFQFVNNQVSYFEAISGNNKVEITADKHDTTKVELPKESKLYDGKNPYVNKKYELSEISAQEQEFNDLIQEYYHNVELYIIDKDNNKYTVQTAVYSYVDEKTILEAHDEKDNYDPRNKKYTVTFGDGLGAVMLDIEKKEELYTTIPILLKIEIIDDDISLVFKEQKSESEIHGSAKLINSVDCFEYYRPEEKVQ